MFRKKHVFSLCLLLILSLLVMADPGPTNIPVAKKGQLPPPPPNAPNATFVNSKRFRINHELQGVGRSGVQAVDVWRTDDGKKWTKAGSIAPLNPIVIEVFEEGRYGFTLVVRNGAGQQTEQGTSASPRLRSPW